MKTLHLTLKKKWFDMILSGEKKEEYREIKPYWEKRLLEYDLDKEKPFVFNDQDRWYNVIEFKNGYAKNAPTMLVEYNGVKIGLTKLGLSDKEAQIVFVISLGNIIQKRNING